MGEIKFDFQMVKTQISILEETADKIEQMTSGSYADAMQELRQGWSGEGSRKFQDKGNILQEKMRETGTSIRQAAEALHEAAVKAKYIEARAKEIAENRTVT